MKTEEFKVADRISAVYQEKTAGTLTRIDPTMWYSGTITHVRSEQLVDNGTSTFIYSIHYDDDEDEDDVFGCYIKHMK